MDPIAVAFWGAFFGTAALMLAAALAAFARSLHRVAAAAALSSLVSALFALAYLGWLPLGGPETEPRVLAHVAALCASVLALLLFAMLGLLRERRGATRLRLAMAALALATVAAGWTTSPAGALSLGSGLALAVGAAALAVSLRSALRGDRLAWAAVAGVACMLGAVAGLSWIALDRDGARWPLHAATALAANAYLVTMAAALWRRYAYLIELREVMAHGPSYDPVTRMRSHAETGSLLGEVFRRDGDATRAVGVVVLSIGNLYALEQLHGRAACNHALFVCASRLRRCAPPAAEMGRLADDGFLLLLRNPPGPEDVLALGRQIAARIARPVALGTSRDPSQLEAAATEWVADVGVGVLQVPPHVRPAQAVAMARAMSRTAWSYGSRVAWYDRMAEQIAELPAAEPA